MGDALPVPDSFTLSNKLDVILYVSFNECRKGKQTVRYVGEFISSDLTNPAFYKSCVNKYLYTVHFTFYLMFENKDQYEKKHTQLL